MQISGFTSSQNDAISDVNRSNSVFCSVFVIRFESNVFKELLELFKSSKLCESRFPPPYYR